MAEGAPCRAQQQPRAAQHSVGGTVTRGTQCSPGGAARARGAGEDTMKMLSGHLCQTPSEEGAQELQCHGSAPVGTRSGATSTGWGRAGTPRRQRALRALGLRRHRRTHSTTQSHTAGGFGCRMPAPAISGCYLMMQLLPNTPPLPPDERLKAEASSRRVDSGRRGTGRPELVAQPQPLLRLLLQRCSRQKEAK